MFGVQYMDKGYSTAFRIRETYKPHLGGQAGSGEGVAVGALCVGCHALSEIVGAKTDNAFVIGGERSLS